MKKKVWVVLLTVASALCLCLGLAGCEDEHTHSFTNYVSNDDATCTADGTETAHCDHEGCTETDTRTVTGSKLGHSFTAENRCEKCDAAWEFTDGLEYELNEETGTYTVTRIGRASGDVVIPYGYQGKFVTSIGEFAFYYGEGVTSITIPGSVTLIEIAAFDCSGLENITVAADNQKYHSAGNCVIETQSKTLIAGCKSSVIPNDGSVTSIGEGAFYESSGLTSIEIPDSVTSIEMAAFWCCSGLTSIEIPDNVISIEVGAFLGCSGLESITVAAGNQKYHSAGNCLIETQSKTLVLGCKASVIPDDGSVTSIGDNAFYQCTGLTGELKIPDSVTSIGDDAFNGIRDTIKNQKNLLKRSLSRA